MSGLILRPSLDLPSCAVPQSRAMQHGWHGGIWQAAPHLYLLFLGQVSLPVHLPPCSYAAMGPENRLRSTDVQICSIRLGSFLMRETLKLQNKFPKKYFPCMLYVSFIMGKITLLTYITQLYIQIPICVL